MADKVISKDKTIVRGIEVDLLVINANDVTVFDSKIGEVVNNGFRNSFVNTDLNYVRAADPVAVAEDEAKAAEIEEKKSSSKK